MKYLQLLDEKDEEFNDLLEKLTFDGYGYIYSDAISKFLELLKDIMNDRSDWIGYFVYELNWGAEYHLGCIRDKNDNAIPCSNLDELYDLLTEKQND